MTYVFYDTETTGTDTAFDQVLQFAAIRTDDELNETGRFEIRCRLLPHIVPAPDAIQVTGIAPKRLDDPALPSHYEMACAIHDRLAAWSPAIFLGWNSIHFDEHLLRQAFYQNLLPPYLTNTGGNGRADMLHITRAVCSLSPGLLTVPTDADGQPRYALDRIAPANGHVHADAHDALADAAATLHMARLVMNGAPSLWHSFTQLATKKAATRFVHTEPVFHLFRRAGGMAWTCVTPIAVNPDNQAEIRLYDLDTDPADLAKLSDDELAARAAGSNPPLTRLKTNQCPIALTPDQAANAGLAAPESLPLTRDRVDRLCNERELRERLLAALPPKQPADTTHVEQQIYDGFPGATDESTMRRFHTVPWDQRPALVGAFRDSRLRHLGNRLLFVERPDLLSPAYRKTCRDAVHRRLTATADTPWRTVPAAIAAIDRLLEATPETAGARSTLQQLRVFLSRRIYRPLTTRVLDHLRAPISRRVPRPAAAIVAPLLSALLKRYSRSPTNP